MLLLKLRPAPTGPLTDPGPGTGTVRLTRTAPRGRTFRTLALRRGQFVPPVEVPGEDYDALQIGEDNLLIGADRLEAIP